MAGIKVALFLAFIRCLLSILVLPLLCSGHLHNCNVSVKKHSQMADFSGEGKYRLPGLITRTAFFLTSGRLLSWRCSF